MKELKVVLVDDESIVITDMLELIDWKANGFSVEGWAYSAEAAVKLVRRVMPDLVFMDVSLPSMDGIELSLELKKIRPELTIVVLSGYMDFTYAQRAIDAGIFTYLVKHQLSPEKLLEVLGNVRKKLEQQGRETSLIRRQILTDCMQNRLTAFRLSETERKHFTNYQDGFYLLLFAPQTPYLLKNEPEYALAPGIREAVSSMGKAIEPDLLDFFTYRGLFAAFLRARPGSREGEQALLAVRELAQTLQSALQKFQERPFFAACLPKSSRLDSLYADAQLLQVVLSLSVFYKTPRILIADKPVKINAAVNLPFLSKNHLLNDFSELSEKLSALLDEVCVQKNIAVFTKCVSQTVDLLRECGVDIMKKRQEIAPLTDARAVSAYLLRQLKSVHKNYSVQKHYSASTNFIIQYINENYNRQPSLTEAADKLQSNSVYIGQKFKKETGMTFHDYLSQCRMAHAKALLAETNLKIFEITDRIGITNSQYFSKVFKESTGQTPNEYRNTHSVR